MKSSPSFTLFFFLLIALFEPNFLTSTAQNVSSNPVIDTTGESLHHGNIYYILPAAGGESSNGGGGITLQIGRNNSCPYEIVQTSEKNSNGLPLSFSPVTNDNLIRVDTDLNIKFVNNTQVGFPVTCPQSSVWRINSTGSNPVFVTTGGVEGNPSLQTLPNWFKIQKFEDGYQIQYCPSASLCGKNPCGVLLLCENVGVFVDDNGARRLALNQAPFKMVFKRA
ncbi:OLC1v1013936C1 [Oldenlandia corymbosa var. corymbosa]|uniref:OLC1v1013936C1 n=1 Tax=Oldenlandia corymbosa var. corymbosa TaxID=529605 RepID=A0AAV1DZX6_OLDCO|nr:OLC1v1013936C1 [Oldenlandia corymbosa var. corymbosa]